MADGQVQMNRVQRELLELKQRGQVKSQADKLKDCKFRREEHKSWSCSVVAFAQSACLHACSNDVLLLDLSLMSLSLTFLLLLLSIFQLRRP
jgi:hypothetical protein